MNQKMLKRLYHLDRIRIIKLDEGGWIVRGGFSLSCEHDEVKRFIFLKRHTPGLSYMRFKSSSFLRPTIFIDLRVQKLSHDDLKKVKQQLWFKLNAYISHRLEQLLVPTPVV